MGRRKRTRIRFGRLLVSLLVVAAVGIGVFRGASALSPRLLPGSGEAPAPANEAAGSFAEPEGWYDDLLLSMEPDEIYSTSAYLIRAADGKVLYDLAGSELSWPASLTKIMTVLTVLEQIEDDSRTVTIPQDIFPYIYAAHASVAGYQPGDEVSIRELLFATMLPSGADASMTLAGLVGGSQEGFVALMNQKAEALGLSNTHFANVTGLHDESHYSSAKDMATLLRFALQDDRFREIFTTLEYRTEPTRSNPEGMIFYNTMLRGLETVEFEGGTMLGGKTGYTGQAGLCLASLAELDGREYILVTTGAPGSNRTEPFHVMDALTVYQAYVRSHG